MARHTEAQIADLLSKFEAEVEAPAPTRSTEPRRTRIVSDSRPGPALVPGLYRVLTMDGTEIDAHADAPGDAVLRAMDIAKAAKVAHYGAMIFMWDFTVTDSEGTTLRGADPAMRADLDRARIDRSNRR